MGEADTEAAPSCCELKKVDFYLGFGYSPEYPE